MEGIFGKETGQLYQINQKSKLSLYFYQKLRLTANTSQLKNPERQYQNNSITLRPRERTVPFTLSRLVQLTRANGLADSETAMECRFGLMVLAMRASGETTEHMVMENSFI